MVRIEPCATTVRSGHVVVRKKRRSSMARLKEAACSTSFCFFFHFFFLLLLLFCETLSSTGLKTQRERKRKKKPSFGSPPRLSLFLSRLRNYVFEKIQLEREREREKVETLRYFSSCVTIQVGKRINNSNGNNNDKQGINLEIFMGICIRRWMDVDRRWVAPCSRVT